MGFKCGLVGMPNVGKSSIFNLLTQQSIPASNYPFCTMISEWNKLNQVDKRKKINVFISRVREQLFNMWKVTVKEKTKNLKQDN